MNFYLLTINRYDLWAPVSTSQHLHSMTSISEATVLATYSVALSGIVRSISTSRNIERTMSPNADDSATHTSKKQRLDLCVPRQMPNTTVFHHKTLLIPIQRLLRRHRRHIRRSLKASLQNPKRPPLRCIHLLFRSPKRLLQRSPRAENRVARRLRRSFQTFPLLALLPNPPNDNRRRK